MSNLSCVKVVFITQLLNGFCHSITKWIFNGLICNLFSFTRDSGIEVRDFGASWRDGVAFLALIDAIKANLINLAEMKKASNKQRYETSILLIFIISNCVCFRLEVAFDVAESKLGIARLLDAEDVDVEKPDEKSIMTYVAQFLHKYPEPKVRLYDYVTITLRNCSVEILNSECFQRL